MEQHLSLQYFAVALCTFSAHPTRAQILSGMIARREWFDMSDSDVTRGVYAGAVTVCQHFAAGALRTHCDAFDTRRAVHNVDNCARCLCSKGHACAEVVGLVACAGDAHLCT